MDMTVLILLCSLIDPNPKGCGPTSHLKKIEVGKVKNEGECFKLGREKLVDYKDTASEFHKIICVKG